MNNEKPCYYAIIPANVRYDNSLKANEKLLYGEITALTEKTGECWASNNYFAELYNVKCNAIATWIRNLKEKKYIYVDYQYKNGTKEIEKRVIKIGGIQKDMTYYSNEYGGGIQKGEENNINITNNTSIKEIDNNKLLSTKKKTKKEFTPPTLEEVEKYCKERNNNVNAKKFFDYYDVANWKDKDGKQVYNWKQKIIRWESSSNQPAKKTREQEFQEQLERMRKLDEEEENEKRRNSTSI